MVEDVSLLIGSIVMIVIGAYANYLYAVTAKKRWNAQWADIVTAALYRVVPDESWPNSERRLHGILRTFKRFGLVLVTVGIIGLLAAFKVI